MKQNDRILTAKELEEHRYPVYGQGDPESDIDTEALSVAQDAKTVRAMVAWLEARDWWIAAKTCCLVAVEDAHRDTLSSFKAEFGVNDEI